MQKGFGGEGLCRDLGLVVAVLLGVMATEAQVTSPPVGKPTVYADAVSESMIAVKWTDVEGETQYRIERRGGSFAQWVEVGAVGGNSANFNESGLAPRTIYAYRVRGWNEAGFGEYSN